jgi:hypothetical protein
VADGSLVALPILHPAYILRGQWDKEPFQVLYLKRARAIAEGSYEQLDPQEPPPAAVLYPDRRTLQDWRHCHNLYRGVSVDIETAGPHITIVGLCDTDSFEPIVLRFRAKGGDIWDNDPAVLSFKLEWLFDILSDPDIPLYFHNGQAFDVPRLEAAGFVVNGYYNLGGDTMLMQGQAYPEAPKRLNFIANVYLGLTDWKYLVAEGEGEAK